MKKIASAIILLSIGGIYFLVFHTQNNIPSCPSAKPQVNSLVKKILGQVESQKNIKYQISDIHEDKVYKHSRLCKAKLNFADGTDTNIIYTVRYDKKNNIAVEIIPSQ